MPTLLEDQNGVAIAEDESTQHRDPGLEDAREESLDVLPAGAPPDDSVPPGLVGYSAAPDCSCCKKERQEAGLPPRKMVPLPSAILDQSFKTPIPLAFCEYCDGDVIKLSTKLYSEQLEDG